MTLYLDFESSPLVGWAWRVWESDMFHVEQDVKIISVAWAEDDGPVYCVAINDFKGYKPGILNIDDKKLVEFFAEKFAKAEYVVAQNGLGFDFKLWRTRLIVHKMLPHKEPKEIDTKRWAKSKFLFTSNSQENISRQLETPQKLETDKKLHYKCIELGDKKYWDQMKRYNRGDVVGLRENAKRMAPFITNAPNANVANDTTMECTNLLCPGGGKMIRRGTQLRTTGKVQSYQCNACGKYAFGPLSRSVLLLK